MPLAEGSEPATEQWNAFALALAASLAPFAQVHLAPKFPPELLNSALANYLSLGEDELLLALIDRGGRAATGRCALTSRRIYWTEKDDEHEPGARSTRSSRTSAPRLMIADYANLPDHIDAIAKPDGSAEVSLGSGHSIKLGKVDGPLAAALARYLETIGRAARAGAPLVGVIDPALAARAARALPHVARLTARGRAFGQDLAQFRAALFSATPRAVMTHILNLACILVYAAMVARGVDWLWPSGAQLLDWGANQGIAVVINQQYWRLCTSMFLHGGIIHLGMNMWSLVAIGPLVERLYGNLAFAFLYLASGIGGAIASLTRTPIGTPGVGASGAICGVLGGLVAFLIVHHRSVPKSIVKSFRGSLLSVVVFMAALGYFVPNIDQAAHLGGFFTGFLTGILMSRPWPVVYRPWVRLRRLVVPFLMAGALAGLANAVARRVRAFAPAAARLQAIKDQLNPSILEYEAIYAEMPSTLVMSRDRNDAAARAVYAQEIEALIKRALNNLKRFRRVTTPYPSVAKLAQALVDAQSNELASLRAAQSYLETGDPAKLNGPGGVLDERINSTQATRSFVEQQNNFLSENDLTKKKAGPDG